MRGLSVALVTLAVAGLGVPAAARAGTVSVGEILACSPNQEGCEEYEPEVLASLYYDDPSGTWAGGAAEANTVTVTRVPGGAKGDQMSVKDTTATIVAGKGCQLVDAHEALCQHTNEVENTHWEYTLMYLGGLDDRLTLDAGFPAAEIHGGSGRDILTSGNSEASLLGEDGQDVLTGGPFDDYLGGGNDDDLLDGREGRDDLVGGGGADTITYASRGVGEPVAVRLDGIANDGGAADKGFGSTPADQDSGVERVIGGAGADTLTGSTGDDVLDGGPGADLLTGGDGVDTMSYASRASGQPVAVRLDGAANDGADPNRDGTSTAHEEGDRDVSIENATGGRGADALFGNTAVNALLGGPGGDRLIGGAGGDLLDGGAGLDTLDYRSRSGALAVTLDGVRNDGSDPDGDGSSGAGEESDRDVSIETVWGGSGPDMLRALRASSTILSGRGGNDRIYLRDGGPGVDHAYCGTGTDSFQVDRVDKTYACETAIP